MVSIQTIIKQFEYYKSLGQSTINSLNEEQLFWRYNQSSNSIAIITKHLWGNMKSRWTEFKTTDGEKPWRHRDTEFDNDIKTKEELIEKWEEGWDILFRALHNLKKEELAQTILIRNEKHTIIQAIHRQLAHYSYHIGQMVYIGKMLQNEEWQPLSIAKGESEVFNQSKINKQIL